jgi:hypothetical protein
VTTASLTSRQRGAVVPSDDAARKAEDTPGSAAGRDMSLVTDYLVATAGTRRYLLLGLVAFRSFVVNLQIQIGSGCSQDSLGSERQ